MEKQNEILASDTILNADFVDFVIEGAIQFFFLISKQSAKDDDKKDDKKDEDPRKELIEIGNKEKWWKIKYNKKDEDQKLAEKMVTAIRTRARRDRSLFKNFFLEVKKEAKRRIKKKEEEERKKSK